MINGSLKIQRFWFIDDNRLEEYLNADDIYHKIEQQSQQVLTSTLGENGPSKSTIEIFSKETTMKMSC